MPFVPIKCSPEQTKGIIYSNSFFITLFNMLLYFPPISYLMPIYNCYNLNNIYFYTKKNTYIKFHRTNSLTHSHSNAFLKHTNAIPFFNKLFIFLVYGFFYIKITSSIIKTAPLNTSNNRFYIIINALLLLQYALFYLAYPFILLILPK